MKNIDKDKIKKILVIQLGPFGDVLLTTAYFETLKKEFQKAKIHYLVKEPFHKIIRNHPFIDKIIRIPKKTGTKYFFERLKKIKSIRKERYDVVIDQQNKPSTKQIVFFSKAKYRVGYKDSRFDFVYNLKSERKPEKRYSPAMRFDILRELGVDYQNFKLYFDVNESDFNYIDSWLNEKSIKEYVVISPGSPVPKKMWSLDRYAELADLIQTELRIPVVLVWGPKEIDTVNIVADKMKTEPFIAPPTDLHQLGALLKKSVLLICNDGGVNHLAVATETNTLAIFGTTSAEVWSPATIFKSHHHISGKQNNSLDNDFGLNTIDVFKKVKELI